MQQHNQKNRYANCVDEIDQQYKERFFNQYGEFDAMILNAGLINTHLYTSEMFSLTTKQRCTQ